MAYNAANRPDVRKAEKASKLVDLQRGEVIIATMSTEAGRRYLWDKLGSAHIFATSYSADALAMAFAEGERNQGLQLLNDIMQYCPEQFILAMREANVRHTVSERSSGSNGDGGDHRPDDEAGSGDEDGIVDSGGVGGSS